MKITLPLPDRLTSHFIVPVERVPFDIESFVPWRVGRPYRRAVSAALGSPLLTVTHHRTSWRPAGVTLAVEERHLLRRSQQHVMISSTAPPHALPTSVQVARATARAVAQECGGLVIDPLTGITLLTCERPTNDPPASSRPPSSSGSRSAASGSPSGPIGRRRRDEPTTFRGPGEQASYRAGSEPAGLRTADEPPGVQAVSVLTAGEPPRFRTAGESPHGFRAGSESPAFRLADDWLGWDVQVHGDATCPPWDPADTGACDCLRVTSRGLNRFALPEITLDGAACAHSLCATRLLRRVANHLVTDHLAFLATHPDATERVIDDHQRIEASAGHGGSPFTVHLTPCDADPTGHGRIGRLKVGPSPGAGQIAYLKASPPPGAGQAAYLKADPPSAMGQAACLEASPSPGAGQATYLEVGPPSAMGRAASPKAGPPPGAALVTHLKVGPPSDFTGSLNDWLCATQRTANDVPVVIGCDLKDPSRALVA
ncbi:hypothetical protein [Nonomuraea sp. NEAU-A123]|uniref:hypothetical protein n=1 Tax=Nonomuraea sp. NEAU-A123 TaxID=2839649 RepID=UPI001BE4483A|nr:hypothetical protein [Nonomuraea sp. NEAU-A123]MBT2230145.1 hypothetical protein [Nonomuraea sp. NEAU-A123]